MDADDLEPAKMSARPVSLEAMSIEALHDYIAGLEAEMARARAAIEAKETARDAAASVFRT
jgi:uncharacterized small protein (DUF1192 family)